MAFIKNINTSKFFSLFGLAFIIFGWLGLLLVFADFFYVSILAVFLVLFAFFLIYIAVLNKKNIALSQDFIFIAILSVFAIALFSYFTTPTVFSGRDQGSLSNAAIALSKNHRLEYSFPAEKEFFRIYGPGQALNFPGFDYTASGQLIPNFSLGYIAWLAAFFSFFGLFGFIVANGISFFLFFASFYALAKNYLRTFSALSAFLLVLTSFIFSWIFKLTLSENLALGFFWFGICQFILFLKEKKELFLFSFLASFGFLIFVRIESLAFLALSFLILVFWQKKESASLKKTILKYSLGFLFLILAVFLTSFISNKAPYIALAKGLLNSLNFYQNNLTEKVPFFSENFYIIRVFSAYALLSYIAFGLLGFFYFLRNKQYSLLIPFFMLSPAFFYLINPSITSDHPWMLRRYVFAIAPLSILYTVIFLDYFFKKRIIFYLLFLILLFSNLATFLPYIGMNENKNLLTQIEKISSNFQKNDLVLIDRLASGDPWSMIAGPLNLLYGKQAVYFFNPNDLDKLDLTKFDKIYFIIPDNNIEFYNKNGFFKRFIPIKTYSLKNMSLAISAKPRNELYKNPVVLPIYRETYVYGKIYLLK